MPHSPVYIALLFPGSMKRYDFPLYKAAKAVTESGVVGTEKSAFNHAENGVLEIQINVP
jgi:hypothetical protein